MRFHHHLDKHNFDTNSGALPCLLVPFSPRKSLVFAPYFHITVAIKTKHYFALATKKRECCVYSNGNGNVGHKPQLGLQIWPGGKTLCDIDEYIRAIKPLSKRGNVGFISHFSITVSGRRFWHHLQPPTRRRASPRQKFRVRIGRQNIISSNICLLLLPSSSAG